MPSALPKLSVRLQPDLERRLRQEAKRRSMSLNEAFCEAVEGWLAGAVDADLAFEVERVSRIGPYVRESVTPPGEIPW